MSMPQAGEPAPDFELPDEEGNLFRLSDLRGQPLILFFYPKDDTPGCTKEACGFRDDYSAYQRAGVRLLGVSPDSSSSHTKFKDKYDLPFTLLADEEHRVSEAYGVWGTKKMFGREYMGIKRTTFLIDKDGKVSQVFEKVKPDGHSHQLLGALGIASE